MFKVILLGDTDYEQSHVVTQITKVNLRSISGRSGILPEAPHFRNMVIDLVFRMTTHV